ncbi:hypothetical protein, partial [Nocardia brasiliensis]|uniref:hypothetical protein n=1 Tax=Nocardia brasiliensis TaxID=37326 RepID=UPI002453864C
MVEQRLLLPAPGLARALSALVLLAGIVAMHTAVFPTPAHGHASTVAHTARADPAAAMLGSEHAPGPVVGYVAGGAHGPTRAGPARRQPTPPRAAVPRLPLATRVANLAAGRLFRLLSEARACAAIDLALGVPDEP